MRFGGPKAKENDYAVSCLLVGIAILPLPVGHGA